MTPSAPQRAAANARTLAGPLLRLAYRIDVQGAEAIPRTGPLIVVGNCPDLIASAVLKSAVPRPLHVLANTAADQVLSERLAQVAGDIPNPAPGIGAAEQALELLASGAAVAILGNHPPVGYLAAASGAPVIPVALDGCAGRVPTDPPPPRSRIRVWFGPVARGLGSGPGQGDPCAMPVVRAAGERVRQRVADAEQAAATFWAR